MSPALSGTGDDFSLSTGSSNLTVSSLTQKYKVFTQEYAIVVDYSTSFIEYQIRPYYTTDYIRYKRVNPQYAGDGTVDQNGAALDSVSMTISDWGRDGNTVWFLESCSEFSIKQSFNIYRDYFELNVTYSPGTKKVSTTYYFGLCSSSNSLYGLMNGEINRYLPGFPEDTPSGYGLGGWYPSFRMYAPACDLRVPTGVLGVEWGYEDTVAYLYSPIWLVGGTGGASVMALKYTSLNSILPNIALGQAETFHMMVRPYKYTDGKERGYDVGYAQWVAPKIAAKWGNHNTPVFPLLMMNTISWTDAFRTWVEGSQVKVATYTTNSNQINWNYKSSQMANTNPDTPTSVPTQWQIMKSTSVPLTLSDGSVVCNPVNGPYNTQGTYRWQLINNDPQQAWWTGSDGVFWDEMNMWTADNNPRNDYQVRSDFVYDGYLNLVKDTYASGYWKYVIANSFTSLLHLSIAADVTLIEGYSPASVYNTDLMKNVQSTMMFVNNIPTTYRPKILVYQNYDTGSTADQADVYEALYGAAKYGFDVNLLSFNSLSSQMHNLQMAEDMFKAMGCTRDSDTRIPLATMDLSSTSTLSTSASMVIMKGSGTPIITSTSPPDRFKLTNLRSSTTTFDMAFQSPAYYAAGTNVQKTSAMTYSTDGKGTYHGSIAAEKTGELVRNNNLQVQQQGSGTTSITLVTLNSNQAKINAGSTGGTTAMILKGMQASTQFDIVVNSAVVSTLKSGSDGTLAFSRAYGSNDVLEVRLSSGVPPDTTPPTITASAPSNGATDINITSTISVTFSEAMTQNAAEAAFSVSNATSTLSGTMSWNSDDTVLSFQPSNSLAYGTAYTITVGIGATDLANNQLQSSWSSSFTTEAAPPPPPPPPPPPIVEPPSAPRGLTSNAAIRQVSLCWGVPTSDGGATIAGYSLYRSTTSGGPYTLVASLTANLSYVDTGLANGVTYYYRITAVNAAGESAMSNEASSRTFSVPTAPRTPYAAFQDSVVMLSWSAPQSDGDTPITGYLVKRSTTPGSETLIASVGKVLNYLDTGLQNGQIYYYTVSAVNAVGASGSSDEVSAAPGTLPTAPRSLLCASGNATVTLTWSAPDSNGGKSIMGYRVYRGVGGQGQEVLLASMDAKTQYVDTAVLNGITYYYSVSAFNVIGEGAASSEASAMPFTIPGQPLEVRAEGGDREIRLNWSAPLSNGGSNISSYILYRWTTVQPEKVKIAELDAGFEYLDQGLQNDASYYYEVRAVNQAGEGAASQPVYAMTDASSPPTPTNLSAKEGNGLVELNWNLQLQSGDTPISGFRIFRGYYESGLEELTTVSDQNYYLDQDLENGLTYWYAVSAYNAQREGPKSSAVSAVPAGKPSTPMNVMAQRQGTTVLLSWSAPTNDNGLPVNGYSIYYSDQPGTESLWADVSAGSLCYQHIGLQPGQECYYRVAAYNNFGEGPSSDPIHVSIPELPSAPTDLIASVGIQSVSLVWQVPQQDGGVPLTGYVVYRMAGDGVFMQLAILPSTTCSLVDTGLRDGFDYSYKVAAVNNVGEGTTSLLVKAVPLSPQVPPGKGTVPGENSAASSISGLLPGIGTIVATAIVLLVALMWYRTQPGRRRGKR